MGVGSGTSVGVELTTVASEPAARVGVELVLDGNLVAVGAAAASAVISAIACSRRNAVAATAEAVLDAESEPQAASSNRSAGATNAIAISRPLVFDLNRRLIRSCRLHTGFTGRRLTDVHLLRKLLI